MVGIVVKPPLPTPAILFTIVSNSSGCKPRLPTPLELILMSIGISLKSFGSSPLASI